MENYDIEIKEKPGFSFKRDLERAPFIQNLAEYLEEDTLDKIGNRLVSNIEEDRDSRKEWMEKNEEWLRLASQLQEDKSYPWPGASNVKYPLLTTAAMQFHARALPSLFPDERPVKAKILGYSKINEEKQKRADRVSEYMSYQILDEQDEWLDELDRMLFILPILGICYKKTFFSTKYNRNKSELILPNEMYVNYYARNFEGANKTQYMLMDKNVLVGLQRTGMYLDIDLPRPTEILEDPNSKKDISMSNPQQDSHDLPYQIYESECWWDLDEDGYKEPYIITVTNTGKILRIVARWIKGNITYNDPGQITEIKDFSQITPFIFLPDPSSATSGYGLGAILGPINATVNTAVNQLTDAGTLSVLGGGFMSKSLGLRGGNTRFRAGEYKIVNTTSQDLRSSIFPLPTAQPSSVLFNLLGMMINSGERLGSITDMMVGENPGQNQKATTTMAVLEQGTKVFTSINKRLYRALRREYKKLYELNYYNLEETKYSIFFDSPTPINVKQDFNPVDMDIVPAADPSSILDSQKIAKSQALLEKIKLGTINVQEATRRALIAEGQTDIDMLMNVPPQPPSIEEREQSLKEKLEPAKLQLEALAVRMKAMDNLASAGLKEANKTKALVETVSMTREKELEEAKTQAELILKRLDLLTRNANTNTGPSQNER